ncbi:hypothetical protein Psesu_1156 [Pseudoxanthomonas suwonensis 11-1]|uniref:Uncharacterized protein n=1 Tax=Pseudoxanthomonas suwonensis (strain 11-1) TaxID=743721 RepID=E6WS57_PSEUU|nr:hypothetical protein [Pseudoxanthomonas suwonensis]ADV27006.1 hypothetical protein Psesu_1156 [Pseudoxanthomonas suwonensis 11-1]
MIAPWILAGVASFIAALAMWIVNRATGRIDNLEAEQVRLRQRIHEMELQAERRLATKDDVREIKLHVESIAATLGEVRDMVIRMEAAGGATNAR